jgi:hypothetical protein
MSRAACTHCRTPIVDYSSVEQVVGRIFCCRNCVVAYHAGHRSVVPDLPVCANCGCVLVESENLVERRARHYCCYNCAAAARLLAA